jgi:hypothetical protein
MFLPGKECLEIQYASIDDNKADKNVDTNATNNVFFKYMKKFCLNKT